MSTLENSLQTSGSSLKKQILKGTFILAAAGIITRVLGLYNRVFLANIIGAGELCVYQLIFPVFMVCNAVCCSGIETALSRLVASYGGQGCHGNVRRLVKIAVCLSLGIAAVLAAGVFFLASPISIYILKEPGCRDCLRVMAPVILFSTAHSCVLGYFYGLKQTVVPATSQLVEQLCRVSAIYILSATFFSGNKAGAILAVCGMVAGDGISCIYTLIAYKIHVRRLNCRIYSANAQKKSGGLTIAPYGTLLRQLMRDAVPLTVNRLSLTMLSSVEAILIPAMMKLYYTASGEAMEIYGVVTGMAMPFVMFPTTLTNSLASMLLPTVAEAAGRKDYKLVKRAVSKSVHYCLLIGIVSMSIFILYGNGLGIAFFKNEMAGQLLTLFAFLCPFMYMSAALASVLNGLGKTRLTLLHNVISVGIRIGFVVICVPKMGVSGYLWGLMAASFVLCALHFYKIAKISGIRFHIVKSLLFPLGAAALGGYISMGLYRYMLNVLALPSMIILAAACLCLTCVYGLCLLAAGCLNRI